MFGDFGGNFEKSQFLNKTAVARYNLGNFLGPLGYILFFWHLVTLVALKMEFANLDLDLENIL